MVVPSKQLMVWRGNQFGPGVYKVKNLNVLGYNTNVIDWVEYYRALKGKIKKHVKEHFNVCFEIGSMASFIIRGQG